MKNVANKKIIRTLSYRTMREKRWKNLIAVLAIALTTLLFTALFTVGSSMLDSIQEATMRQVGSSAHGGYKYLSLEEYEKIKAAGGYRDISFDIIAGFAVNPELNSIQTEVRYAEGKMAKWSFCYPEEGRMPEKINECAASSKVLEALGVPLELGARVPLIITSHDARGNELLFEEEFVLSGFWYSNEASFAQELWVSKSWVYENIPLWEENYNTRLIEKQLWNPEGSVQAAVWFASSFDIESQMEELTEHAGFSKDEIDISVNWAYAVSTVDAVTVLLGIGLLGIIILSGYLIIYNIFYINVTADIRYYGLLKTIGTTGRQLRRMVRLQALMLSAAGIPLGLLAGWFVGKGVLPSIYAATDTGGVANVVINPFIFAGSAVFSLFVVYLSCVKPCRLATGVAPIEAVRYVDNAAYRKKEKKTGKITALRLAAANMGRNKRKAAVVIASLSLSLILLNATYGLVNGFRFDEYVQNYLLTDMQVSHYSTVNHTSSVVDYEAVTPEFLEEISQIDGVEKVNTIYCKSYQGTLSEELVKKFTAYYEREDVKENAHIWELETAAQVAESGKNTVTAYSMPEELLSYLIWKEGTFDREKFEQGGYALGLNTEDWLSAGDKITIGDYEDDAGYAKEVEIMAVAEFPYSVSTRIYALCGASLLLSEKDFRESYEVKGGLHACVDVEEGKEEQVKEAVNELIEQKYPELVLTDRESLEKEFSAEINMFSIVGGLLGFILALIGILNLVNAMITSILARRQEFAMMQAVGMTGRELKKMLTMEGIWYGVWTLGIAATFGNVVSYGLIYMLGKNMAFFEWSFHILPLAASIPVIAVISIVLPVICYHTLCRRSIIERLRLAEV